MARRRDSRLAAVIALLLLAVLFLPTWPYSHDWGYVPSAGLFVVLLVVVLLMSNRRGLRV